MALCFLGELKQEKHQFSLRDYCMRTVTSNSFSNSSDHYPRSDSDSSNHYPRRESRSPSPTDAEQQVVNELKQKLAQGAHQEGSVNAGSGATITSEEIASEIIATLRKAESVEKLNDYYGKIMEIIESHPTALTKEEKAQLMQKIRKTYSNMQKSLLEKSAQPANNPSKPIENNKRFLEVPTSRFRSQSSRSAVDPGRQQRFSDKSSSRKSWIQSLRSPQSTVNQNRQRSSSVTTGGNQPGFFNSAPIIDTIYSRPSQGCPKICSVM